MLLIFHKKQKKEHMMRIVYNLIIPLFFSIAVPALAMQNLESITIQEITAVKKPIFIAFRNENHLMVASQKEIYTIDWKNNKRIEPVLNPKIDMQNCLYNKQTSSIAAIDCNDVNLYNDQNKKIWHITKAPNPISCAFTPNGTLYTMGSGILQNSHNETHSTIPGKAPYSYISVVPHPREEKVFYTAYVSLLKSALCTIKMIENARCIFESKDLPIPSMPNKDYNQPYPYAYSPIMDIIALYYPFNNNWSLLNTETNSFIEENLECYNLAFHPKKQLLAIITKDGCVELRDILTKHIILKTAQFLTDIPLSSPLCQTTIDFSKNGDHLAFVVSAENDHNKCFVLSNLNQATD